MKNSPAPQELDITDRIIQFQIRHGFEGAPLLKPHNEQARRLANIAHEEFFSPRTLELATFMGFKVEYLDVMSEIKPSLG